ncbi:MAG: hypothetical protein KG003_07990 [Bacteroidetes bacterium]|nr:hypothetical protein [Bacteroidota bacterium]
MKKEFIRGVLELTNGPISLNDFEKTEHPDIYKLKEKAALSGHEWVYFNGFDYIEINPLLYGAFQELNQLDNFNQFDNVSDKELYVAKNHVKKYIDEGNWVDAMLFISERVGFMVYLDNFDKIPDDQKYDAFINLYTRCDFGFHLLKDHYRKIFDYAHLSKEREERLNKLKGKFGEKKKFRIFHGVSYDFPVYDYYSWTLNEMTAQFFAYRYSNFGEILQKDILFKDAVDYLSDRNEEEILFSPSDTFLKLMFRNKEEGE